MMASLMVMYPVQALAVHLCFQTIRRLRLFHHLHHLLLMLLIIQCRVLMILLRL